jgi:sec-independent protein translocase protein TatB
MFDLSWTEILIIGVVALIAIGPKELPGALRALGHWMGKVRRMASEFQDQFRDAMREAEVADLKKQVDEMTDTAKGYTNFDPLADMQKDIDKLSSGSMADPPPAPETAPAAAASPPAAPPAPTAETAAPPTAASSAAAPSTAAPPTAVADTRPPAPEAAAAPEPKAGQGA